MKNILLLAAMAMAMGVHAQWTDNVAENTLVAEGETSDVYAVGSGDGHTYVVFWNLVPAPTNYELRLQVLDADGYGQLGPNGMVISDAISMSTFTFISRITTDDAGNLYVGVTGTNDNNGYLFKLDVNGNHLWPANGVVIPGAFQITALPLQSGETIVCWNPSGTGMMQKYDASGAPIWDSPMPLSAGSGNSSPENLFELSNGDFVAIYHTYNFGISSTLYAQRFDGDGNPMWSSPTQLSNQATVFNTSYSTLQDGDAVYIGYFGSTGTRFDSFLQRIDPDGTLPWGINGSDFDTNQTSYEMSTHIAFEPGSEYVYAICTYTNSSQDQLGEYAQKFDKATGERQYGDQGKELFAIASDARVHASPLHVHQDHPFFLLKKGMDNGVSPTTLDIVKLDPDGNFAWPGESLPVATYAAAKRRTTMTAPTDELAVAVFVEDKGEGDRVYAQEITEGITGIPELQSVFDLTIYPNPTSDVVAIEFTGGRAFVGELRVYDVLGSVLKSKRRTFTAGKNRIEVDLSDLPAGMYHYELTGHGAGMTGKVIRR